MENGRMRISDDFYSEMKSAALKIKTDEPLRNSILNMGLDETALNHASQINMQHTFSHDLKTGKITAQNKSGRCWLFAGLNTMRHKIIEDLNLVDFELSQSYQMFFDKVEKANYFLENIIDTIEEDTDSRVVMWLLSSPLIDGGQWDMFTSIVEKYGVVPKSAMPETYHSSNSARMNRILTLKVREYASILRKMQSNGRDISELRSEKKKMLIEFYRLCTMFLGIPPDEFTFEYTDKERKFHRDACITPMEFYRKYIDTDLESYVSIINSPTGDKPFNRTYTVQYLGNIEGGNLVTYLNVEMSVLKDMVQRQLMDGIPVWFGCDVGKYISRDRGILDMDIYDYEGVLRTEFSLDKAGRLDYGESVMTHAMVFTGVNIRDDGSPDRWKVENSWSDKYGDKGYFVMSDSWFDEFAYQAVINRKYLSDEQKEVLKTEPIVLNPWDPMGSLALHRPDRVRSGHIH
ncbi:aminopeptidase [Candidatus Fermentibacteria bacterium]|nr:MAG: aminopeptidase [Candidatus Fermentibacteria bacterium]